MGEVCLPCRSLCRERLIFVPRFNSLGSLEVGQGKSLMNAPRMLKEYFDRDSSISEPITVVNTDPQESNVFEPEVNSDFIDKSDPGPSKLENSDILRNLNNKLSHLEPSQQEELKQLIHEYERLFPDIPTRTDKIYQDVIVEDSKPIKQHPYRMNPLKHPR